MGKDRLTDKIAIVTGSGQGVGAVIAKMFAEKRPDVSVLTLDNHAVFGGEAKQNEFEVDGYRLWASNGCVFLPNRTKAIGWHHH